MDSDISQQSNCNARGTDRSRSGSCWCAAFRAGLRAGSYPRHADRREGRNDQRSNRKGRNCIDQTRQRRWPFPSDKGRDERHQSGKFVGITSFEQDGKRVAREVHVFDESLRGLAEGHYPWDLEAKPNMMTNANISKIDEVGADRVVRVNYKGGEQTITIPTDATVVAFVKAPSAGELAVGRKVFVVMKKDSPEAAAVVIGAEGIKPPM